MGCKDDSGAAINEKRANGENKAIVWQAWRTNCSEVYSMIRPKTLTLDLFCLNIFEQHVQMLPHQKFWPWQQSSSEVSSDVLLTQTDLLEPLSRSKSAKLSYQRVTNWAIREAIKIRRRGARPSNGKRGHTPSNTPGIHLSTGHLWQRRCSQ